MRHVRSVALVSEDLMFASRLQAAMRRAGGSCALVVGDAVPSDEAVFVDLNESREARLAWITALRAQRPDVEIVGFCGHAERAVRRAALAAGATRVVNNGALETVALLLAGLDVRNRP